MRDLIETGFRRRKIVFVTIPAVLSLVLLITLVSGKLYQSEMKILVQNARGNVVISADKSTASPASDVTEEQINSELEILHSRDVLDLVADPAWNAKPVTERTLEEINQHDKLLTKLEKRLVAESGRKSNVITVTFQGRPPQESQHTLTRLEPAFLNQERHLERPAGASDFFVQESDRYRQAWNEATQRFVDFQQAHQLVSLPDQEVSIQKDIVLLQAQLREMDTSLRELNGRLAATTRRLGDTPQRQVTETKTVPNQQSVQQLNTLAVTLENKRTTLLTQFKPDDRLVQEVEQQIRQTRAALEEANRTTAQEQTTDVNPAWQQLRTKSVQDDVTRQALVGQRAGVIQQLATLQGQLSNMQGLTGQFNLLKSKADELKENYQLYSQKREQAQIEDAMDARQLLNVTVAERDVHRRRRPSLKLGYRPRIDGKLNGELRVDAAFQLGVDGLVAPRP